MPPFKHALAPDRQFRCSGPACLSVWGMHVCRESLMLVIIAVRLTSLNSGVGCDMNFSLVYFAFLRSGPASDLA